MGEQKPSLLKPTAHLTNFRGITQALVYSAGNLSAGSAGSTAVNSSPPSPGTPPAILIRDETTPASPSPETPVTKKGRFTADTYVSKEVIYCISMLRFLVSSIEKNYLA